MLTRKDYIQLSDLLVDVRDDFGVRGDNGMLYVDFDSLLNYIEIWLTENNPRFDKTLFQQAFKGR